VIESTSQARLRALEALLLWEGEISHQRLRSLLGCQSAYTSRLIRQYQDMAPRNIERVRGDPKGLYRATRAIKPTLSQGDIHEYLVLTAEQRAAHINVIQADYSACPPKLFGQLHRAARLGTGLAITYYSLNRPKGVERVIHPHALICIGQRWHARAYSSDHEAFRDFNIGRIDEAFRPVEEPAPVQPDDDIGWQTHLTVRVIAHESLTGDQRRIVEREYFGKTAARRLNLRACLLNYTLQAMRVATDTTRHQPPEYLLQLASPEAVHEWLLDS